MSKIRVDTEVLKQQQQELEKLAGELEHISEQVTYVKKNISWKIASREQIKVKLSDYSDYIGTIWQRTNSMSDVLQSVAEQYEITEKQLGAVSTEQNTISKNTSGGEQNSTEDEDILSIIKKILAGMDKFEDNDEAGVLNELIAYLESLKAFLTGDKTGITGAEDWCDLVDESFKIWEGLYDYFCQKYKGMTTGFFGEKTQGDVGILGVMAGFFALISSIMSASEGLSEKQWQSIVADYLECVRDVGSIMKSGYNLEHIGDMNSLTNIKDGPWSAMDIYSAIGEAAIRSIEQGFRSYEKYSADGQWDMGDTGASGIDVALEGFYGFSHSLTNGLDDLIFRMIDEATGGNGTVDMSYIEKAAEGWKIIVNKIADRITNRRK